MEHIEAAFEQGIKAATADVAGNRLTYRWIGHAGHWGHWIAIQLADRFGVAVEALGICFVTAYSVSFDEGYNRVLVHEIERRHGIGAFQALLTESRDQSEECLRDAKQLWMKRNGLAEPSQIGD